MEPQESEKAEYHRAAAVLRARHEEAVHRARADAEAIAHLLVRDFGAKRVWLFGSLAALRTFRRNSDIDLAVEGLDPQELFRAIGRAIQMSDFSVDITPMEELPQESQDRIRTEGEILR